ncbi:GntR family transcriptional regulator [Neoroseomonas lacus]|uniref:HTH gntR-type domain-containing protein n=1 Tax=Neoroseomonas lacus TaxID=287609 RepID=A0A917KTB4_9PROT|nr:GntR family transcriptional regulator [Neoroseomonas lacus]GGJ23630.1 hypothetical protein GCM10011320_33680 [Neoroseomonas lacus]
MAASLTDSATATPLAGRDSSAEDASRVALYLRLSRVFRERIAAGEWAPGALIPGLPQLCEDFQVSRVTMRQALAILAQQGLIGIGRGRGTWVMPDALDRLGGRSLRDAISDTGAADTGLQIKVLQRTDDVPLAADLRSRAPQETGPFTRILKRHHMGGRPFALLDYYIEAALFRRFPQGAESRFKLGRLLRQAIGPARMTLLEEVTLTHADPRLAELLGCGMGEVLVRMRRWYRDAEGRVPLAGTSYYRGDGFALEVERPLAAEIFPAPTPTEET